MKTNTSALVNTGKRLAFGSSLVLFGLLFQTAASASVNLSLTTPAFTVQPGGSQQLATAVTGSTNTAVTWSVQPAVGSVSASGVYTAPAGATAGQTVTITAKSVADPTKTATTVATVNTGITFALGSAGLTSLAYQGQSVLCQAKANPGLSQVTLQDATGKSTAGSNTPTSVVTSASGITDTYPWGTMTTAFTGAADKLQITVTVHNSTPDKTITHLWMLPVGLQFPSNPVQNPSTNFAFNVDAPSSVYFNYASGAADLVNEDVTKPLALGFWQIQNPAANQWFVMLDTDTGKTINPNWPAVPRNIAPNGTDQYTVSVRFGGAGATENQLAGDIFALYARTFPSHTPAYTNKPIASLVMSSRARPGFPKNPRGWLNDPTIDVTTSAGIAAFHNKLLKWADGAVTEMQRVGAQGAIIWDPEGQEYDSSYVGDPSQAETIAPELTGVLDAFVAKFTSMGFRVGFTLRSQEFHRTTGFVNVSGTQVTWAGGSQFASSWVAGNNDGSIVIGTTTYAIQSVQSATSLTLATSAGNQTAAPYIYTVHTDALNPGAVLEKKIQYAKNRWGANMFYVDTDHNASGAIDPAADFQALVVAHPDTLIMPEWKNTRHFAYTTPYNDAANKAFGPSPDTMAVYPKAAAVIKVSDASAAQYGAQLLQAATQGSILMFDGWYRHPANDAIQQMYMQVH